MKTFILLIAIAVSLSFLSGQLLFKMRVPLEATVDEINEIEEVKRQFSSQVMPLNTINLHAIFYSPDFFKLFSPIFTLPDPRARADEISYSTSEHCFSQMPLFSKDPYKEKIYLWEQLRCEQLHELPDWFFEEAPFMHPSGFSYAYLAYLSGRPMFKQAQWIKRNLIRFHVVELREMSEVQAFIQGPLAYLITMSDDNLRELAAGRPTVLNRDFLIARTNYGTGPYDQLEYRIYLREELENFLKLTPYSLDVYRAGKKCFWRDGPLCWMPNTGALVGIFNARTMLFFFASMVSLSLVLTLMYFKIKDQKLDEERKRMALSVLSHEFRTPIAGLMLDIENMQQYFNELPPDMQEGMLRVSDNVNRLKRLTESSKNYLKANQEYKLIDVSGDQIKSLNSFLEEQISRYEVEFKPLEVDQTFHTDSFWLGICLKNLIENALVHGKPPVVVTARFRPIEEILSLEVLDQGQCQFERLSQISGEFVKRTGSPGMGLGLNIVGKVMKELGGEIIFEKNPTRFTLILQDKKSKKNRVTQKEGYGKNFIG